jgi:protein-S-isoprenylcysteine O-methyltransferase Ste14
MFGFGVIINSFFVVLFTFIALFISKSTFLSKQEKLLEEKYGAHYLKYKKLVKF